MVTNTELVQKERCRAIAGTTQMQCLHSAKIEGYCILHWETKRKLEKRNTHD